MLLLDFLNLLSWALANIVTYNIFFFLSVTVNFSITLDQKKTLQKHVYVVSQNKP